MLLSCWLHILSYSTSATPGNLSFEREGLDLLDGVVRSPHMILPFPKAQPRIRKQSSRRRRSAVVTSTPEKTKLEEAQKAKIKPKPAKKRKVQRNMMANSHPKNRDRFCIVYSDSYSNSAPGEVWVQCDIRQDWSHEACTAAGGKNYICDKWISAQITS